PLYSGSCDKNISLEILREQKIINHLYVTPRDDRRIIPLQDSGAQAVQVESVAMLILTGHFIGYLPDHYAAAFIARGQLCELGDDSTRRENPFCLMMKKGRKINPIIRLFMQALGVAEGEAAH
ncbi:LysR substrate-binding domain-containing protein, partial [Pantoea sp. CTOTU49201]|uniref:LysR substrate-binding domain-containing protein n=1 Tax=Pantoea sp. CTOTU49201 TaxID=2953855 RepID=UPI0039183CE9